MLNGTGNACDYYRTILPYRHLREPLQKFGVELQIGSVIAREQESADAFVVYRQADSSILGHLLKRQSEGTKLCYDVDDDMLNVPEWSPAYNSDDSHRDWLEAWRQVADRYWCSTDRLAESMVRPNARQKNPQILPNLVDLDDWNGGSPHHPVVGDEVRLIWAGSNTHLKDLKVLDQPLRAILDKYPQVSLHMVGDCIASWHADFFGRVHFHPWVPLFSYPGFLQSLRPHIGLCPLTPCGFNQKKSNIKFLEMTLAGAAVVASDVDAYTVDTNLLFACNASDWYDAMEKLVTDHEYRRGVHNRALDRVRRAWSWQHSPYVGSWVNAYKDAAGVK